MAVKRYTFEIDDSPDPAQVTSLPDALASGEAVNPRDPNGTDLPARQPNYQDGEEGQLPRGAAAPETVGRTYADLLFAFTHRPQFAPTAFLAISFAMFATRINSLADLWRPGIVALSLNAVWFGIAVCRCLRHRRTRRTN